MENKTITEVWNEWEKTGEISKEWAEILYVLFQIK